MSGIGEPSVPGITYFVSAALLPCGVSEYLDVCVVLQFNHIDFNPDPPVFLTTYDNVNVGSGIRVAPRWPLSERVALFGYIEGTIQFRTISFGVTGPDGKAEILPRWFAPPIQLALGIGMAFSLFDKESK